MRECFVAASNEGEHARRVLAELHLSAREAFDGVTVPLDVPVRKLCVACGGRGEIWSDPCATLAMAAAKRSAATRSASSSPRACRTAIDLPSRYLPLRTADPRRSARRFQLDTYR